MAKHKIKDPKAIACTFLGTLFLVGIVIFFTMGGLFFSEEHPKVLNYANSMCQVDSRSTRTYQCKTRYSWYTCYGPTWDVHHGEDRTIFATVETQKRYRSYADAFEKAKAYEIGSSYSCWYDTRNPSVAQWDKPSITVAVILLSCGGLSVLLTVFFFFLTVRLVKQEIFQKQFNNMDPYSFPSPYVK